MSLTRFNVNKMVSVGTRLLSSGPSKANNPPQPPSKPATAATAPKTEVLVGPGASKEGVYKNPEYYTYNTMSFYDIEKDMKPFRIPQPSSLKK